MLVEVPIYMAIDHDGRNLGGPYFPRPSAEARFMIRFDTENDAPIEYAKFYGPKVALRWHKDDGDVFGTALGSSEWSALLAKINADPESYVPPPDRNAHVAEPLRELVNSMCPTSAAGARAAESITPTPEHEPSP